ncbi:hypothetical protein Z043_110182 [Scleropages formosus]|uniref:Chemokine interleukin-8-like domain-containing protein n=1 Tax=Scleropages formosus TaxID=113540 RepID=A0A0P7VCR4_SCLFO|nr:hypothetical protein Z043_110182 [Scleropages formosus]
MDGGVNFIPHRNIANINIYHPSSACNHMEIIVTLKDVAEKKCLNPESRFAQNLIKNFQQNKRFRVAIVPKGRCLCKDGDVNFIPHRNIQKIEIFSPSPACKQVEIIVTLKDGGQRCLNSESKFGKTCIKKAENNKRQHFYIKKTYRMQQENPNTHPETSRRKSRAARTTYSRLLLTMFRMEVGGGGSECPQLQDGDGDQRLQSLAERTMGMEVESRDAELDASDSEAFSTMLFSSEMNIMVWMSFTSENSGSQCIMTSDPSEFAMAT